MTLNLAEIRSHFPSLTRPCIYFDNPGGTQIAMEGMERMRHYLMTHNANHGGEFPTSRESDAEVEDARKAAADFVNAYRREEIIFGPNMTGLTYSISRALGRTFKAGDTLLVTHLDHDANISPWLQLAEDYHLNIRWVAFNPADGTLDLADLKAALQEKPRLLAVGYASNSLGTVNPLNKIIPLAHAAGALVYVDAVQFAPHGPIDVQTLDCDFLVCSSYKYFGPHLAFLYGKYDLLESLPAYKVRPAPLLPPGKFETGTGQFENIAGLYGALEYLEWVGQSFGQENARLYGEVYKGRKLSFKLAMSAIRSYEFNLSRALLEGLRSAPGVTLYGPCDLDRLEERVPTFSFTVEGWEPKEVASRMAEAGINVWAGNFYALEITTVLGLEEKGGLVRVGAAHYNTLEEVHKFTAALRNLKR